MRSLFTARVLGRGILGFSFALVLFSQSAQAQLSCMGNNGQAIGINNGQVLNWKVSTPNQFHARANVMGTVVRVYPDQTGHHHFSLLIGNQRTQTIEIVYNEEFGSAPVQVGASVEACGDYITATQVTGSLPPSPDGAIVHWVHQSDNPDHPSGFLVINGVLYGNTAPTDLEN